MSLGNWLKRRQAMLKKFLVLYVPVLHQGYLNFFQKWRYDVETIYIFGCELTAELVHVEKEIRAINPDAMAAFIAAAGFFKEVRILRRSDLPQLEGQVIITADEGISRRLVERYFPSHKVVFDQVFLRWDEKHVAIQKPPESFVVSNNPFDRQVMRQAREEGGRSSDWWRRVGAVLVRDGKVVLTGYNQHLPSELSPYVLGDIRDFIPPGQRSDVSSAIHAEKAVIASAAKKGISTNRASLYVSTFPCSDCAAVVAFDGIKKCFFGGGHASFHGEDVLKFFGVELIYVK